MSHAMQILEVWVWSLSDETEFLAFADAVMSRLRSGMVSAGMAHRHFLGCLKSIPAFLFWEKTFQFASQAVFWDLGNW